MAFGDIIEHSVIIIRVYHMKADGSSPPERSISMRNRPVYKTWIRKYKIILFFLIGIGLLTIALCPLNAGVRVLSGLAALPFLYISIVLSCISFQFSSGGNDFQSKIHDIMISRLRWSGTGRLLDIGAGSGSLIIKAAKAFPEAVFVGIDYWGKNWAYSKKLCETNAAIEAVSEKVTFIKASAARLPFSDHVFDAVMSCLTFHEVKDETNKRKVLTEAFRVLKPGGTFVLLDLFGDERIYGDYGELLSDVRKMEAPELEAVKLATLIKLPRLLQSKQALGYAVLLIGKKEELIKE